ncbi:MAG: sulfotransferase family 2 domain-containing protein [Hormoscilla sp.]
MAKYLRNINGREQQIVSIHIPKTAGTSIAKGLTDNGFVQTPLVKTYSVRNIQRRLKGIAKPGKHAKALDVRAAVGEKIWEECFTFAFVRNPWDLMVSSYNWWLQKGGKWEIFREQVEDIRSLQSFSAFIRSQYGSQMLNEHYGSFVNWICDRDHNIIVNFVGKVENLDNDWAEICNRLGLENKTLPHANKTRRSAYQDYYDEESRLLIERRFEWSIQQFGYSF